MMRVTALKALGGFNASLIAGEEPELCVRLRQDGGTISRIDDADGVAESGDHFSKFSTISQWFQTLIHPAFMQRPQLMLTLHPMLQALP